MATAESGAVRWVVPVVAEPAGPWIETESREPNLTTSSREPQMVTTSTTKGERELVPVG
jgi:hypothetical protein